MAPLPTISFGPVAPSAVRAAVLLTDEASLFGGHAALLDGAAGGGLTRALVAAGFKGRRLATLDLVAPAGLDLDRILVVSIGAADPGELDWLNLGGVIAGRLAEVRATAATIYADVAGALTVTPAAAAALAAGAVLRSYRFDTYKSRPAEDAAPEAVTLAFAVGQVEPARAAWARLEPVIGGVVLARDLINEPANVLGTLEFADRALKLASLGIEVEILGEAELQAERMAALLGVAQGSARPPRVVILRWNGAAADEAPLLFVGKGVVFDSGGISIKPAAGMEDMKGDMGGAAAVTGLLAALAGRRARVNAVGVLGLVENMPDGAAQRPGDIVRARSGTTIEVINTDAEGRLVLADALHYAIERFRPRLAIDLATLTGAIMVALGSHHAGLFSNDDHLAAALTAAGLATGERVWRMPLGPEYDKMIESKVADIKNTGGRYGGSITAAQFLKRFVGDTPWAHLDIAGTAMGSPATEISRGWSSGFGVRLLDRLVADNYEGA
ncbi:leucyl aminopeptidase [Pseudoxanthobacter sp.]|uniref:leucyl aminopeptidase n=1 Tax=Pseudoxanthobacter sp. TaxID=1925742 RepID=UPI002FE11EB8